MGEQVWNFAVVTDGTGIGWGPFASRDEAEEWAAKADLLAGKSFTVLRLVSAEEWAAGG